MFAGKRIIAVLSIFCLAGAAPLMAADVPLVPYVEVTVATPGPISLFCSPGGGGNPLTQAFDASGHMVDGTISMILYDTEPPYGVPVPFYPREDIWLIDALTEFVPCISGGAIPDADTDADGITYWVDPLHAAGHVDTGAGNQLAIMVSGWVLAEGMLPGFSINSSDFNGDGIVNLTDVAIFSSGYFGAYSYAMDLHWDGAVNLSDVSLLAATFGDQCP